MFDIFVAQLECPSCGAIISDAEMQTHIRGDSADSSALEVGFELDRVDLTTKSIVEAECALVKPPDTDGLIRLLDIWICPKCQTEQWAMVEIDDWRIHSIEAIKLDRKILEFANFISDVNADLLAEALQGEQRTAYASSVEILQRQLP